MNDPVALMSAYFLTFSKFILILMSVSILVRCIRSMLSEGYESETWGYLRVGREPTTPILHWENIIGRSLSSDVYIDNPKAGRVHAVLTRTDKGLWKISDVFSKGGVWVNNIPVSSNGTPVADGDTLNFQGTTARFIDLTEEQKARLEARRPSAGKVISSSLTLLELTVFQLFLLLEHALSADEANLLSIALAFFVVILLEWCCYSAMRVIDRTGFEAETIAFYLTTLGMSVAASSTPRDMFKQILLVIAGVVLFLLVGAWMRNLRRTLALRYPIGFLALALLAVNVALGDSINGSTNWLSVGGFSFQPSELVKVAYIYTGASTLGRLYHKRNLFSFIVFSAICVVALALIGDFGTAVVFFVGFLIISFMRSGSLATVLLAISGAGMAGVLAVSIKPYIARRFASWGHVWEDVYNTGYQQTRAMSAAASGGLFGKGAGAGWLEGITAANTDMVFAMVCEELGLIIAVLAVIAVLTLAFFAVRSSKYGRSSYYAIAACAASGMMLVQVSLNVFGSMDILPFTGVTFPFVSRGGSSMLSCWLLMAFIKSADTRRGASFAVHPGKIVFIPDSSIRKRTATKVNRRSFTFEETPADDRRPVSTGRGRTAPPSRKDRRSASADRPKKGLFGRKPAAQATAVRLSRREQRAAQKAARKGKGAAK